MEIGDPVVSSPQGKPIYRDPSSLLDLAGRAIATTPSVVQHALDIGLPSKIISIVFSTAVRSLVSGYHRGLRESVVSMTSRWPCEKLSIVDQVGQEMGTAALTGTSGTLLIEWLMEGLLTTRSTSRLRELDLSGYTVSNMFLVPLLWLSPEERTVDVLLKEIHSKYSEYLTEDDSNIEEILTWKVNQLTDSSLHGCFEGTGPVKIRVDVEANLSEWLSMGDELLGLMVSNRTPFTLIINKLAVNNFHTRQTGRLRWLLSLIDKQNVKRLGVYGYRKSVSLAFYEFYKELKGFTNLTWFAWATSGPKLLRNFDAQGPTAEDILFRSVDVLCTWRHLTEMFFNKVTLTNQVSTLLNAVENPLSQLFFRSNHLGVHDLEYLSTCHHVAALREFTIEKTNLRGMGSQVSTLVQNTPRLRMLNLQDTNMDDEDKVDVMMSLQNAVYLETIVLIDNESVSTMDTYELIAELSCKVDIRVDCQANVSEWVSVCDEVLGIMVSGRTPFNLLVHKLSVNNYQSRQAPRIKWLLSMIDTTSLKRLGLYGYRKSVDEALHIFHGHFKHLPNLTWFAWATCGPKVLKRPIDDDNPSQMEILVRGADVFHSWSNLTEGCFHGVLLTDMLAVLLNALPNALRCLYLVSNELSIRDVDYLAWSHHLDNLRDLTIEKNNLEKMGQYVAELAHNATSLKFLSLKDTNLLESDKMEIMLALQDALILQTFVFFDTHSMLSTEGYLFIIESACHIKTLRNFYIFPFNHEPFEKFQREHVYKACMEIIMKNDRKDLSLAY